MNRFGMSVVGLATLVGACWVPGCRTASHASTGDSDPGDGAPPGDPTTPSDGTNPGDDAVDPSVEPATPVIVGGAPSTCIVYDFSVPLAAEDGVHKPWGSAITYEHNPPTSGPNNEMWAQYGRYVDPLPRPHWVHNLRHGAIVLIYRPDAPADVVTALAQGLNSVPYPPEAGCPRMGIITPDPELQDTYAVLAWGWMMTSNCTPTVADIAAFSQRHIYQAPEKVCGDGAWPVRAPCFRFEDTPPTQWTYAVPEGTPVIYDRSPPSSGPYYPTVLRYGRYDAVVPAPYWTGILAKGGIVVLYRPDAPAALIQELKNEYDALPPHWKCGSSLTAMVQDPTIENPYALVGFNQYTTGKCLQGGEVTVFVTSRRFWGPFPSCDDGTYVPPGAAPAP